MNAWAQHRIKQMAEDEREERIEFYKSLPISEQIRLAIWFREQFAKPENPQTFEARNLSGGIELPEPSAKAAGCD